MLIRPALEGDLPALAALYGHHVLHGTGTFETEPPDATEMGMRLQAVQQAGWPWIVAEDSPADGTPPRLVGYAYANRFRPRQAFQHCVEDSVYLAPQAIGRGVGRLLLAELIARCEACGARQMVAVIGDAANAASIGLHRALGFQPAGQLHAAGWKHGRWLDVVFMQRALASGSAMEPGHAR